MAINTCKIYLMHRTIWITERGLVVMHTGDI